jgi:hypothetical protein
MLQNEYSEVPLSLDRTASPKIAESVKQCDELWHLFFGRRSKVHLRNRIIPVNPRGGLFSHDYFAIFDGLTFFPLFHPQREPMREIDFTESILSSPFPRPKG